MSLRRRPTLFRRNPQLLHRRLLRWIQEQVRCRCPCEAPLHHVARTYVVVDGDSLSKIALKFYGNASRWPVIYDANRTVLANQQALAVGMTLRLLLVARSSVRASRSPRRSKLLRLLAGIRIAVRVDAQSVAHA